jgi:hypothetical protein
VFEFVVREALKPHPIWCFLYSSEGFKVHRFIHPLLGTALGDKNHLSLEHPISGTTRVSYVKFAGYWGTCFFLFLNRNFESKLALVSDRSFEQGT